MRCGPGSYNIARRPNLPFRAVNRAGSSGHDPALQRHHLLPCQLLSLPCFRRMFDLLGLERIGFDDFRRNGLLLPARENAVRRLGMPLHRGPHRDYNAMVIEKVGRIESLWSTKRGTSDDKAHAKALARLGSLQDRLRLRLLDQRHPLCLNRRDPLQADTDFSTLDALAEQLWQST